RDMEKELAKHDAYLPSYPASKDICSIGGAIGNNAAGPDSLRYGHCAEWIASLDVVLHDGHTYTIQPLSYKEYQALVKRDDAYGRILKEIFTLIEKNEKLIEKAKPKTKKNTAGYALWHCLNGSVAEFKKGKVELDLTRLIAGSQGTIGVITKLTMRAQPIAHDTELIAIPVFNLADAGAVVVEALKYDPINVEVFDGLSFDLAMKNPDFFKDRLDGMQYYKVLLSMYTCYHVRWKRQTPEFTLLVTVDGKHAERDAIADAVASIQAAGGTRARHITSAAEREMFWQIRRASYTLSKFQDPSKRPAAFLEDMTVPPENLAKFFAEVKKLLKEFGVTAAVHGHGGNGHFHFYPLLDFTKQGTGDMVEKMAETFFDTAVKHGGNICGEHNDGIARTPYLNKLFTKKELDLFKAVEHIFDPDDIFNPGKKVNPRFDVKETLRKTN
ncbi:MAG TPA: FAD-binding oxidoreductase, partial [Candidatus Paceibacterota bacterium]|nr:FAD-binding oxidoreductase [Candidatus Paceibacterota bacterium]